VEFTGDKCRISGKGLFGVIGVMGIFALIAYLAPQLLAFVSMR